MFDSDFTINGKHATITKHFVKTARLFPANVEVYKCAVVFGLLYNTTAAVDTDSEDDTDIPAGVLIKHRDELMFLYRLVMLLDTKSGLTDAEKADKAFRDDADPNGADKVAKNMQLFNSYARGGLEVMYSLFLDGCHTEEEYVRKAREVFLKFSKDLRKEEVADPLSVILDQ